MTIKTGGQTYTVKPYGETFSVRRQTVRKNAEIHWTSVNFGTPEYRRAVAAYAEQAQKTAAEHAAD